MSVCLTTLTADLDVVTTVNIMLHIFYYIKTRTHAHTQEGKEEREGGEMKNSLSPCSSAALAVGSVDGPCGPLCKGPSGGEQHSSRESCSQSSGVSSSEVGSTLGDAGRSGEAAGHRSMCQGCTGHRLKISP